MKGNNSLLLQTNHSGSVNKAEFSYNGMKFATCGNDGKINIYSTEKIFSERNKISPEAVLIKDGHSQPIYDLSFSHPCYGTYLASCGYDKKLIIWKERAMNDYQNIYEYKHNNPVKCCKFAPYQYGIIILCGANDGSISIHELQKTTQKWNNHLLIDVHKNGVNSIDWAPANPPVNLLGDNESDDNDDENIEDNYDMLVHMSFISCGNDCKINIFQAEKNTIDSFTIIKSIDLKKQVPKDIAFLNFVGYTELTFACGLDDGKCLIYKNYEDDWKNTFTINLGCPIVKICWSNCGTYLGISSRNKGSNDNNPIRFFRQNMDETWVEVK